MSSDFRRRNNGCRRNSEGRGWHSGGIRSSGSHVKSTGGVSDSIHVRSSNNMSNNDTRVWKQKPSVDNPDRLDIKHEVEESHERIPISITVHDMDTQIGDSTLNQTPQSSNTPLEPTSICTSSAEFSSLAADNSALKVEFHEFTPQKPIEEESSNSPTAFEAFDICPPKKGNFVELKPPLFTKNRERRKESKRGQESSILRPGMVLLKNYITFPDQVMIVNKCRDLGIGGGGFYQPGYREGAKLHLRMMCLGWNWDPEDGSYGDKRPVDGANPPAIPTEFYDLVNRALHDSLALIKETVKGCRPENILPLMRPDICIVNFYTSSGRLGLHKDKDESEKSLEECLPVVSFSLGDSGEFLYGDERDTVKAEKVLLESGDVLIFGGKSRHVFHGVSRVIPDSAPKSLVEETRIRPGRLNLTFRQY